MASPSKCLLTLGCHPQNHPKKHQLLIPLKANDGPIDAKTEPWAHSATRRQEKATNNDKQRLQQPTVDISWWRMVKAMTNPELVPVALFWVG